MRICPNRTEAKNLLKRIEGAIVNGTWRDLQDDLRLRNRGKVTFAESAERIQTDGEHWYIVLDENTKSRKYRYVPLTGAGLAATQVLPDLEGCPYVFYNPKTMRRRHTCPRTWENARVEAGVPDLQVKDLRRQFAIDLAERGTPMHDIQQVLGHASVATTEKYYAHFSPENSARRVLRTL